MRWKLSMIDCNTFLCHRKNPTRSKNRNSFGARLELVRGIACNDRFLVIVAVVLNVIDGHYDLVAVVGFLVQKSLHHRRHTEQWRERHPDGIGTDVGAR
jgi:hypothetical protein